MLLWCTLAQAQPLSSVLKSGSWFKLAVDKNGVYKINSDLLRKMGVNTSNVDPRKIKIYGYGGGMLPQANSSQRPVDLTENAIFVSGESDGKFDSQDYILFYGEGADKAEFDLQHDIFFYEKNLYSNENFYFFTVAEDDGKRVGTREDLGRGFPVIREYNDYVHYETDEYNDQRSGREWFGEKFGGSTMEHTLTFTVDGISNSSTIKIVSDVMGQSHSNATFKLFFNDINIGDQPVLPIPNTRYGVKGIHKRDTFLTKAATVGADRKITQQVKYQFIKGTGFSQGYLDFLLLNFDRSLRLYSDETIFLSAASLSNSVSQFEISSIPEQTTIWDITNPFDVKIQNFITANGTAIFSTSTDQLKKFIVFNNTAKPPVFVEKITNQDLHGLATPALIIVTHPDFKSQALRLSAHRQSFSNWSVQVVTTDEIYNEFASGRQDVSAIRDFVKYLYDKTPSRLKALLLFGKGSYDFKDRVPNNKNFVITYESRSSLHPLQTYSSDDYFGFLENNEGYWSEEAGQNHTLDIGVGRLPVTTEKEAKNVVDKIIDYDTNKNSLGYWRKQIVFVADDGNNEDGYTSLHQYQADQLAQYVEQLNVGIDTRKLFMGSFTKTVRPSGDLIPAMTAEIVRAFDRGSVIINYTGHGSETQWGDEKVFSDITINELNNELYPFLVTATCAFGRHDNPNEISSAELSMTREKAGAIGLVTTARPVNATTNFNLNQAFYEALFEREGNYYLPIGAVFKNTKNNSTSGVANRNFSLLGDPSITLALPTNLVQVSELKTIDGSDTLKALSTVIARGEIKNASGEKLMSFNGTVEGTLFDKETRFVTIGKNDPPFTYDQWSNALFRGKATVKDGVFQLQFTIPKNIAYQVGPGKFSLYASDPSTHNDAGGADNDFQIGGSETLVIAETIEPRIRLFIGDTTFINGGITTPDTYLLANLTDNSGINISSYGIGNSILAVLDNDTETFILNDYYVANTDDPTSGWIKYPILDLAPGRHTLKVKTWDLFNNTAEATIDFIVTDGEALVIESFGNYPNPFHESTTVFFTHNRSGDDLQAQLYIQSITGEVIKSLDFTIPASDYKVDLMNLNPPDDFDKKLSAGLYLARLVVRSLTNGSKNEQVTKLIVLN